MKRRIKSSMIVVSMVLMILAGLLIDGFLFLLRCDGTCIVGGEAYRYDAVDRNPIRFLRAVTTISAADDCLTVQYKLGKPNCVLDPNSDKGLLYDLGVVYLIIAFDWKEGHLFRVLSSFTLATTFYPMMQISFTDVIVPQATDMPWLVSGLQFDMATRRRTAQ